MNESFPANFETSSNARSIRDELYVGLYLPPELLQSSELQQALDIAADVISRIDQVHGNGQQIIRSAQTGNYATFHHGQHTREVAVSGVNYLAWSGITDPQELSLTLLAGAYHDAIQGQAEPGRNEELSAQLAEQELAAFGYDQASTVRVGKAVRSTRLLSAEKVVRQRAYDSDDAIVVGTAIGDLGGLAHSRGPLDSLTLFAEFNPDMFAGYSGVLTQTDTMHIIDATPGGRQRFADDVARQGDFFRGMQYPIQTRGNVDVWRQQRLPNAAFLDHLGRLLIEGALTVPGAYEAAGHYAAGTPA